jgi:hypothetical protein
MWSPLAFLGQSVVGSSCHNNQKMAGLMIPPDILNHKSLFSLLYRIDQDLAERTRARRCPSAGVHCTTPTISESLEVGPRIWKRHSRFVLACAAAVPVVAVACCHHRCVSGAGESTGLPWCCWSALCGKATRLTPLSVSRRFMASGDRPSTVGKSIFGIFLPRASAIGGCWVT